MSIDINKWILSHFWRLLAVTATLAAILTGVDVLTGIIDQWLFPKSNSDWLHLFERSGTTTPFLMVFLIVLRKMHGSIGRILRLEPVAPAQKAPEMAPEFILNLKRFLGSAPRLTGLLRNQLDETNRISAEFAISVLTQISSVQIQASHLLSSLTDVRSQTASMCDQAQKSIESSKRKLQEMSEYTTSREAKLRDDSEAIQQVVTLMKDLLPLTSLIGTLSKQTRLLALNAAIQAANDHTVGRGFVAVADEMRKLALQIDSTSAQVDGVMRRVTRITEDKLLEMVSVNRIQTEKNWLHTLTDSMTQMSQQFQAAVFGLDRLSRDSHEAVQTIFNAVLKAQETAQFQDISRQQIELVQHGLDLCGDRLSSAGDLLSETANDRPLSIEPLEDLLRTLEDRYSMQSQQTIHDRALSNKSDDGRGKEPIVELF